MTNPNCTTSSAVSENLQYPVLAPQRDYHHVSEESDSYGEHPADVNPRTWAMKQMQLRALQTTGFGQIERLYQLSTLLRESDIGDWDQVQLGHYAKEIQDATSQLETLLCDIVDPLAEKQDPEKEDDG